MTKVSKEKSVGGLFFFVSVLCALAVAVLNIRFLPLVLKGYPSQFIILISLAALVGAIVGRFIIQYHLSVFLHELKHSIVSNFAGNKAKGMKIRSNSGHFAYEYTASTAHLNAFIALAPYWLPLFSSITLGMVYLFSLTWKYKVICVGLAFGADLGLGARDISPIQTDLTSIRGGYLVGLTYVIASQIVVATLLIAWSAGGFNAIGLLIEQYLKILFVRHTL